MSEELDLEINTKNVNMELSFVANAFKPKTILALEVDDPFDLVSLLLNADENSLLTAIDCRTENYELTRELFASYDIAPRLSFYSGEPDEIAPWIEGKFDLIVVCEEVDESILSALSAENGHIVVKKDLCDRLDMCEFEQISLENVVNYSIFK